MQTISGVSKRIQSRFENPNYYFNINDSLNGNSYSMPEGLGDLYWEIDGELKLKVQGYKSEDKELRHGMLDLALDLVHGRHLNIVAKLSEKELESFFRDENHIPAYADETQAQGVYQTIEGLVKSCQNRLNPIVCTCHKIRYKEIEDLIRLEGITDYKEIVEKTGAASSCGSCISQDMGKRAFYITDILNSTLAKMRSKFYDEPAFKNVEKLGLPSLAISLSGEKVYDSLKYGAYSDLKTMDKIKFLTMVFDEKVRTFLQQDGGDIELTDVDDLMVFVQYQGACGSCSSSTTGTLEFITKVLRNEFGEKLVVIVEN